MVRKSKRIIIRDSQIVRMFKLASTSFGIIFIARQTAKNITVKVISPLERATINNGYKIVYSIPSPSTNSSDYVIKLWKTEWRPALWRAIRENPFFEPIEEHYKGEQPRNRHDWGSGLI